MNAKDFFLALIGSALSLVIWHCLNRLNWKRPKTLVQRGEELVWQLDQLKGQASIHVGAVKNGEYKFFTSLLQDVLYYHRTWGVPLILLLNSLRESVLRDVDFERKMQKLMRQHYGSFLFLFFLQLFFMLLSAWITEIFLPLWMYGFIEFIQVLGFVFYFFASVKLRQKFFTDATILLPFLYRIYMLLLVGAPFNYLQKEQTELTPQRIKKLSKLGKASFDHWQNMLASFRQNGINISDDWWQELQSCYQALQRSHEAFSSALGVLRLAVLSIIFLGCYFAHQLLFFKTALLQHLGKGAF